VILRKVAQDISLCKVAVAVARKEACIQTSLLCSS